MPPNLDPKFFRCKSQADQRFGGNLLWLHGERQMKHACSYLLICLTISPKTDARAQFDTPHQNRLVTLNVTNESPLEVLLAAGEQTQTPLGLICNDSQLLSNRITVNYKQLPIKEVLGSIVALLKGYDYIEDGNGVFVIRKLDAANMSQLFTPIRSFQTWGHGGVTKRSFELWCQLQEAVDPTRTGYGGTLHTPSADQDDIPTVKIENATVPTVLSWLASQRKGLAWVIWPPPSDIRKVPQYRLWNILYYDKLTGDHGALSGCCLYVPTDILDATPELRARFPTP